MGSLYSASANAFFDDALTYPDGTIPADAVRVTPARHRELMAAQEAGISIVPSESTGRPVMAHAYPTLAERRALLIALARMEAHRRITAFAPIWKQLNDARAIMPSDAAIERGARIDRMRNACDAVERRVAAMDGPALDAAQPLVSEFPEWLEADL